MHTLPFYTHRPESALLISPPKHKTPLLITLFRITPRESALPISPHIFPSSRSRRGAVVELMGAHDEGHPLHRQACATERIWRVRRRGGHALVAEPIERLCVGWEEELENERR